MNTRSYPTFSAIEVAKYFFKLAKAETRQLTNMQLQKLVYFAHGYVLAATEHPLVKDSIRAWDWGPVIPPLYEKLQVFGRGNVEESVFNSTDDITDLLAEKQKAVMEWVWRAFKDYSGRTLSRISHAKDAPWSTVWKSNQFGVIPNETTQDYYSQFL